MLQHNSYFDGEVQSIGFERLGRRHSVGVVAAGQHKFGTEAAERMTVVSGEFAVRREGDGAWTTYPAGTFFEVAASSSFEVKVSGPTAYLCEYL